MHRRTKVWRVGVWILAAMVVLAVAAFYLRPPTLVGPPHVEIVKRLTSPDDKVDALVEMIDGGATTSRSYCVFIVPKGRAPGEDGRMLTLDSPSLPDGKYGLVIIWKSPTELEVSSTKVKESFEIRTSVSIGNSIYSVRRGL